MSPAFFVDPQNSKATFSLSAGACRPGFSGPTRPGSELSLLHCFSEDQLTLPLNPHRAKHIHGEFALTRMAGVAMLRPLRVRYGCLARTCPEGHGCLSDRRHGGSRLGIRTQRADR